MTYPVVAMKTPGAFFFVPQRWGVGSGVSLFMCANVCSTVWWKTFSWASVTTARGVEKEGAFFAVFHLLITRPDKVSDIFNVHV